MHKAAIRRGGGPSNGVRFAGASLTKCESSARVTLNRPIYQICQARALKNFVLTASGTEDRMEGVWVKSIAALGFNGDGRAIWLALESGATQAEKGEQREYNGHAECRSD